MRSLMQAEGMGIRIERYRGELAEAWADVLRNAKNSIFQFERGFIEYHGDRFDEISLLAFDGNRPIAAMPAAIDVEGTVTSHPGLTFGGVILDRGIRSGQALEVFDAMLGFLREHGVRRCVIKALPSIFASYPSAELEYALWRSGFALRRRDLSSVLPLRAPMPFNGDKTRGVKKALKAGLEVGSEGITAFHDMLQLVWQERHGVNPVHSRADLELLQSRFPDRILCRCARQNGAVVAGALVFDYGHVWHTQYMASSPGGRDVGGLDVVISEMVREATAHGVDYFSFGASTLQEGRVINEGLLWQKESYGARAIVHDFYEGDL